MKVKQLLVLAALVAATVLPSAVLRAPAGRAATADPTIVLTASSSQSSCLGFVIELTATPNYPVAYGVTLQDGKKDILMNSNGDGSYGLSYSSFVAGDHDFIASGDLVQDGVMHYVTSLAVSHTWVDSKLTLSPSIGSSVVGSPHQLTASVNCPLDGTVTYDIAGPGVVASPLMSEIPAGSTSTTASYTSAVPGTDSITASLPYDDGAVLTSNTVTQTWTAQPIDHVTVSPDSPTYCREQLATLTATVTQNGAPLSGAQVRFVMSLPGAPGLAQTATTGATGTATVTFTRSSTGTESISATVAGSAAPATAQVQWRDCPVSITLAPPDVPTPVGTNFTAIAHLTKNGSSLSGITVRFSSVQAGQPVVTPPSAPTTDASGSASFSYQRSVPGPDTVFADVTVDGTPYRASLAHQWTASPDATLTTITLVPDGTTSVVGSQFTATATVLDATGNPRVGVPVAFSATMTGASARTGSGLTSAAGRARFGWTRQVAGTDTLSALVRLVPAHVVTKAIKHYWKPSTVTNPPLPGGPLSAADPSPVPGETDTAVGSGCPAGAQVELRVDARLAGAGSADSQGRFAIPFRMPGVAVGRHLLLASCGLITTSTPLDYVLAASGIGTSGAAAVTTAAVLAFFVLLGLQLLRPRMTTS